jgi:ketosteroid isomerase-like protein
MLKRFALALLVPTLAAPAIPAHAASDSAAVMATVNRFVAGFNQGDTSTMLATCASPAAIIDDFGRHEWMGPTACADWARDWAADARREGDTNAMVTLGNPGHVDVSGDVAYVVVPATYAYKQHGKPVAQNGAVWTLVLKKSAAGWRIAAWAWADP